MAHIALQDRRVSSTKKSQILFWRNFFANHNQAQPNLNQKRQNLFHLWHNCVDNLLAFDIVNQNIIYILFFYTFSQHWSNKIFSVSNDGIEWSLNFGPNSVTLTEKDLVQEVTISSQEYPLSAWSLLLPQKQQLWNNHLARVPVTPNQQGTNEMMDEVISSVGALDMDTSGYQVSGGLDDADSTEKKINWM